MGDHVAFWFSQGNGLIDRVEGKLGVNFSAYRPANNPPGTEILKCTEVIEVFFSRDISEIGEPHLIDG